MLHESRTSPQPSAAGAPAVRRHYTAADLNEGRGPIDALLGAAAPASAAIAIAAALTSVMVLIGR